MHYDLGEANEHARWAFGKLRFVSCLLKDELRRDGHWDDFTQELYATAYHAWQQGLDVNETRRLANRRIHAFLKAYGYKAYRNSYVRQETTFSASFPGQCNILCVKSWRGWKIGRFPLQGFIEEIKQQERSSAHETRS